MGIMFAFVTWPGGPAVLMAVEKTKFLGAQIAAYYAARVPDLKQSRTGWWRGRCPIHQGERDAFAVNLRTGGWRCHSECDRGGSIVQLEMEISKMDRTKARRNVLSVIEGPWSTVARYIYRDEAGEPLYRVVRRERGEGHGLGLDGRSTLSI